MPLSQHQTFHEYFRCSKCREMRLIEFNVRNDGLCNGCGGRRGRRTKSTRRAGRVQSPDLIIVQDSLPQGSRRLLRPIPSPSPPRGSPLPFEWERRRQEEQNGAPDSDDDDDGGEGEDDYESTIIPGNQDGHDEQFLQDVELDQRNPPQLPTSHATYKDEYRNILKTRIDYLGYSREQALEGTRDEDSTNPHFASVAASEDEEYQNNVWYRSSYNEGNTGHPPRVDENPYRFKSGRETMKEEYRRGLRILTKEKNYPRVEALKILRTELGLDISFRSVANSEDEEYQSKMKTKDKHSKKRRRDNTVEGGGEGGVPVGEDDDADMEDGGTNIGDETTATLTSRGYDRRGRDSRSRSTIGVATATLADSISTMHKQHVIKDWRIEMTRS